MDLAASSVLSLIYRVTGTLFVMLVGIVVAHALSDADRGVYVSIVAVMTAVGSIAGSFAAASGYFVSNRKRDPGEVAANSLFLSAVFGGGLGALLMLFAAFYEGEYRTTILLVGIGLLPMVARPAIGGVYLGMHALARYSFALHGPWFVGLPLLLLVLFGLDERTVAAALGAFIAGQYLTVVGLLALRLGWLRWFVTRPPSRTLMTSMVTFGALTGVAGFITFFNYRVDQLLVLWLAGREQAGIYPSAVFLAEGLWFVSTSMAMASYASIGAFDRQAAGELTSRAVRQTMGAVIAGAAILFIFAPWLLRLLYPDHHSEAATALRILCVGTALFAPQSILSNFYTVQLGRPWIPLGLAAMSMAINIVVSSALIPALGYEGGAWGTTVSYLVTVTVTAALFLHMSGQRPSDLLVPRVSDVVEYAGLMRRGWRRLQAAAGRRNAVEGTEAR